MFTVAADLYAASSFCDVTNLANADGITNWAKITYRYLYHNSFYRI